jgi:Uncharacterized protein conserved in bacteria
MNYLAHIFLSGSDGKRQLGNFIGDAVKGNSYRDYPPPIAEGVLLHRAIDTFTDNHPAIKETVRSLKPHFGRYSGILLDIYFDYLLASRFDEFSSVPLKRFTKRFYRTMIRNRRYLPDRIKRFMWHFILTNRLSKYATTDGIKDSLKIMVHYNRIAISVEEAIDYLTTHEEELRAVFRPFFHELQAYSKSGIGFEPPADSSLPEYR